MELIQSVLLGLIQGIVEWLPISSEGQAMLFMVEFLKLSPADALSLAIFLHLGTMLAVILKFRIKFLNVIGRHSKSDQTLLRIIIISTLATGITGVPLFFLLKSFNQGDIIMFLIGLMLILTGILLRAPDSTIDKYKQIEDMKMRDMIFLGLAQGLSILPGVSRSGTTITFLLLRKLNQKAALEVSFLISVPAVLGAVALSLLTSSAQLVVSLENAIVMISVSFLAGYATIDILLRFAERLNFSKFCIILGLLTIGVTILPWIV